MMLAGSPGRRLLLVALASAASSVSDAFFRAPPTALLLARRTEAGGARARGPGPAAAGTPPRLRRVGGCSTWRAGDRPGEAAASSEGPPAPSQQSKLARARQLLDDSRLAFEESRSTRAKAGSLGREWGLKKAAGAPSRGDLQEEFRLQAQWTRAGRALYGTWVSVFGGRADMVFASDPLGLQQSGSGEPGQVEDQIRAAFERLDLDRSGAIESAELEAIIREMTGATPDKAVVKKLMSEVRARSCGVQTRAHARPPLCVRKNASLTRCSTPSILQATLKESAEIGEVTISREDFSGPMRALLDQKRALGIAAKLAQAGSREREQVVGALELVSQEVSACSHGDLFQPCRCA